MKVHELIDKLKTFNPNSEVEHRFVSHNVCCGQEICYCDNRPEVDQITKIENTNYDIRGNKYKKDIISKVVIFLGHSY